MKTKEAAKSPTPIYRGVVLANTAKGWQVAWAKIQGASVELEFVGEPTNKVAALDEVRVVMHQRLLSYVE